MALRVLITGKDSYVGESFKKYIIDLDQQETDYIVENISVIGDDWKKVSFEKYDVVFHVAGIVHINEKRNMKEIYFNVNCRLAEEIAIKAKESGVKQFVFMSSMSVYGISSGKINQSSQTKPKSYYGWSKLLAEEKISKLRSENFSVAIIRAPMIYGKGCKGNYVMLSKYAAKLPIFPDYINKRSMIYIDNLSAFIKQVIDKLYDGIFLPQNEEYVCTSSLVFEIANIQGRKIRRTKIFNPMIKYLRIGLIDKVFGDLTYEKIDICDSVPFKLSVIQTEEDNAKQV